MKPHGTVSWSRCGAAVVIALAVALSGCRIEQKVDGAGRIESQSGNHDCDGSCPPIEVTSPFQDTFIAKAYPGNVFVGWRQGPGFLCGGSTDACAITVSAELLAQLPEDATGVLQPLFSATTASSHLRGVPLNISETIEAEDLELVHYQVEKNKHASGKKVIALENKLEPGSASTTFGGRSGEYFVVINYLDETDGVGHLSLQIDEAIVDSWLLDKTLGSGRPNRKAFTARTSAAQFIQRGAKVTLTGRRDKGERARVDLIQFIPKASLHQAEQALFSPEFIAKAGHPGYTGSGFVDFRGEGFLEWVINVPDSGVAPSQVDYALEFRYSYGKRNNPVRPLNLRVNDEVVKALIPFPNTGVYSRWKSETALVRLRAGSNTIRLESTGASGADIDYLAAAPIRFLNTTGSIQPLANAYFPEFGDPGYEDSYYGKVDPQGERETLAEWLDQNGFTNFGLGGPNGTVARYINAHDLGFGREMRCLDNGRSSCFVKNYLDPKGASNFAATVAMERMGTFVAFFVYDQNGRRINQIALDTEGPKAVPESCFACHGGTLDQSGNPSGGSYLPFDIGAFEHWPGHERLEDQSEAFRELNRIVWRDAKSLAPGGKASIVDLIEGWYHGEPRVGRSFDSQALPKDGWYTDPNGYEDIFDTPRINRYFREQFLYRTVYGRFCRTCHVAQALDWQKSKVTGFEQAAYRHICDPGTNQPTMPHAEVTFDKFNYELIDFAHIADASARDRLCAQPPPEPGNPSTGKETFVSKGCTGCHQTDDLAGGTTGGVLSCDGSRVVNDLGTLTSAMTGYTLSDAEVRNVSSYLDSFPRCNLSAAQ